MVSSPLIEDPNFKRTAVLILDQDENGGYIGLIMNRELNLNLKEVCHMPGRNADINLQAGGPVDLQRIFWIHTLGDKIQGGLEVLPGLSVGGNYDDLISLFMNPGEDLHSKIRLYLGYSGWGKDQLEHEINSGVWGVIPSLLDPTMLLNLDGDELWQQLCMQLGKDYEHWCLIPSDISMN